MSGSVVIFRILVFFAAFMLEVKVRAAEVVQLPSAIEIQQAPEGCLSGGEVCAVRTGSNEKFTLIMGVSVVHMDRSTSLLRLSDGALELIEGTVWVQAKSPLVVRTEFGEAKIDKGEFWVGRTAERMNVAATDGMLEIKPRGASETLVVEKGWENWIGKVGKDGRAETGLPYAIPFGEHIERWARLYGGTKKQFEKDVRHFGESWALASRQAAEVHQALFARKVAALEEEKKRREEERSRVQARDRVLLQMFRHKVLEE